MHHPIAFVLEIVLSTALIVDQALDSHPEVCPLFDWIVPPFTKSCADIPPAVMMNPPFIAVDALADPQAPTDKLDPPDHT